MKPIYVIAYTRKNLGDDLFIQALLRRYPETRFYLFADPKNMQALLQAPNLRGPSRLGYFLFRGLQKLGLTNQLAAYRFFSRRAPAVVRIGGSVFIEPANWESRQHLDNRNGNPNTFYIGCNFGPYHSQSFLENAKMRLQGARDCCFRDRYSAGVFSDMPNIRYAPDVLFAYDALPVLGSGEGIGISLLRLEGRKDLEAGADAYYTSLAGLCDLCARRGIPVTLLSFCQAEGDLEAVEAVLSRTNRKDHVQVCNYQGDTEDFLQAMNRCRYLIAGRFHAMILGWCMGKAVLPAIYSQKQTHVLEDIAYAGPSWQLGDGKFWEPEALLRLCMDCNSLDTAELAQEAQGQFAALDAYMTQRKG